MSKVSETYSQLRTRYNNNLWKGRLILAVIILLLVLVVVRVSLPYTIIYSVTYWLNQQGVATTIEDISINVRKGTFTLTGARGIRDGDELFNIGRASIDWDWRPLQKKTIHITSVELEDFNLEAKKYSDAMVIAGVAIREGAAVEETPAAEEDTVDWGASLRKIDFGDVGFCFQQIDGPYEQAEPGARLVDYCGSVQKLTWQGDIDYIYTDTTKPAGLVLKANGTFQVKDIELYNNELESILINIGDASLANININSLDDINLEAVNIDQFALLQHSGHSSHKHAVEFSKLDISDVKLSNTDSVSIGSIELSRPVISMARDETGKYKYERWLLATQGTPPATEKASETASNNGAAFNIQLGNISITESELCYEELASETDSNTPALDYCLNLDRSDWKGNIAVTTPAGTQALLLSLTGDLDLSNLITTNNLLKRDLLTFERLMIKKVAVNSLEDIVFASLDLDNVAGLELTTSEDRHTVTVANLDVSDFSFRQDTLEISRVSVNDMGVEITLNEDGSLDLDKWKIASEQQQQATDADTAEVTDAKPVKVKIGEFSLDSKRQVEFTDMSVTPTMQIGLAELYINIKNLDSEKPGQKSPLEFRAKTLKHGTIDINGVAMPFESKPSFDATGKITGLDLRVASSKAEQAIGHIIKSGQMDADLKLLSDKGQLDSSISLVLYHFNLKAKSKEDAAALDKKFGMPINQSLMLLKDKKDRIKLKIPITGDVNNPEFDPTDAIIKATAKATTVTLVTFYTPYGLAYAGGNVLFNLATDMNFEPLVFDSGSSKLTNAHDSQLGKLAELLTERPGIHLVLCGSTNLGDRDKLFSEIIDPKKAPPPPSAERLEKLKQLAVERQENVKNQLVTQGKIAHNRLILCEPEHSDQADDVAGVEISI